jgi:CBS domain-containing protein
MRTRETAFRLVPVARVMTRGPATVEETAPLSDAAAEMAVGGFRHLPVVDAGGRLTGMISERDLRARLGADPLHFADAVPDALAAPVSEAMTPDPVALGAGATLGEALALFADERVGAIPVVDPADRPVGIVSYLDLLGLLRERLEADAAPPARPAPAPRARARGRGARGHGHGHGHGAASHVPR